MIMDAASIQEALRELSEKIDSKESILLPNEPPKDWLDETQEHPNGFVECNLSEVLRFIADMI